MIELHRPQKDPFSDQVEDTLKNLVVAHQVHRYDETSKADRRLPYITESDKIIDGRDDLKEYLYRLKTELQLQRAVSGDACYIDPETGEVC